MYPAVFKPDAVNGLSPEEVTLAEYLKMAEVQTPEERGNKGGKGKYGGEDAEGSSYATSIIG